MLKGYSHFVREIYTYCDNHVNQNSLFPAFVNLWNENGDSDYISKRDLTISTSKIICRLLEKNVLLEIPKDIKFNNPYGLYKILPHKNLMRYDEFAQKRSKLVL